VRRVPGAETSPLRRLLQTSHCPHHRRPAAKPWRIGGIFLSTASATPSACRDRRTDPTTARSVPGNRVQFVPRHEIRREGQARRLWTIATLRRLILERRSWNWGFGSGVRMAHTARWVSGIKYRGCWFDSTFSRDYNLNLFLTFDGLAARQLAWRQIPGSDLPHATRSNYHAARENRRYVLAPRNTNERNGQVADRSGAGWFNIEPRCQ